MSSESSDSLDASLLQLERELQSLTPLAPSREFVQTLKARMEPVPRNVQVPKGHTFPWRRMVTPAAAAAAAVAVMSVHNHRRAAGTGKSGSAEAAAPAIRWEPMPMRSEYRALLEAGYVLDGNFGPEPQYRLNSMHHHEWRNAADNSSIRLTIPRQQRFVLPASHELEKLREGRQRVSFQ